MLPSGDRQHSVGAAHPTFAKVLEPRLVRALRRSSRMGDRRNHQPKLAPFALTRSENGATQRHGYEGRWGARSPALAKNRRGQYLASHRLPDGVVGALLVEEVDVAAFGDRRRFVPH